MDPVATVLSALAAPHQQERLLRLHTPLGPDVLVAETLNGRESVDGGGFRFDVGALSANAGLPLDDLLGQPVLLELLTAESHTALRPFHGHVTAFERLGSNGGLARYRLRVEPWLALLAQRVDSYVFQDMSVVEIAESVFADYAGQGALAPAWRWELSDRSTYARRSLTTQYEETDFAQDADDLFFGKTLLHVQSPRGRELDSQLRCYSNLGGASLPQQNGLVEQVIRTLKDQCVHRHRLES
ncbi:type VI secretion system Vgr family protein, partial [Xanthomonas oryzae]|uniref:type VI secretion system Vgr family protein n=1 Tax=Xanthomonas oryzae TaxID=347 RepID=UPI000A5D6DF6